jgi:DNA-binding XRE family transcriptional regulator
MDRVLVGLSQDINELRDVAGWSQDATARAAGIAHNTILDLEKARTDPHISTLVRIAYALGYVTDVRFRRPQPPG